MKNSKQVKLKTKNGAPIPLLVPKPQTHSSYKPTKMVCFNGVIMSHQDYLEMDRN